MTITEHDYEFLAILKSFIGHLNYCFGSFFAFVSQSFSFIDTFSFFLRYLNISIHNYSRNIYDKGNCFWFVTPPPPPHTHKEDFLEYSSKNETNMRFKALL